ncbi:MAG: polyprenyl synthetase family protein [Spirochaetales bacterium]|nr:polyprenyl synthetase family protein [Spirochaetales bacterium]
MISAAALSPGKTLFDDPQLQEDLAEVRRISLGFVSTASPLIRDTLLELFGSGEEKGRGKMLRPALVILAGRSGKWNRDRILPLAAAVEFLHNATLIHDDIIDNSPLRRGQPALHKTAGPRNAVLTGDYLLSCCFSLASRSTHLDNGVHLSRAVARICEGEINQNLGRYNALFSLREYRRRIAAKTAALFCMSLLAGAREAGCPDRLCLRFLRIGYCLGMAFQIVDDVLDYAGQDEVVGKSLGRDIREGVFTLPLIYALIREEDSIGFDQGESLRQLLAHPPYTEETVAAILRRVELFGGAELSRREAAVYLRRGEAEINGLPPGYTRRMLLELSGTLLYRSH